MWNWSHPIGALIPFVIALAACSEGPAPETAIPIELPHRFAAGSEDPWREVKARVGNVYRNGLYADASAELLSEWRSPLLSLPSGAQLEVAAGVMDGKPTDRFRVSVDAVTATGRAELFTAEISGVDDWRDLRLPLPPGELRLRLRSERSGGDGKTARSVWSVPRLISSRPVASARPNVILVSLDTLRADHLGAYGYARDTSPNLDRFFEEGVLFEQAFSPSSWTTPAHATILTGHHPAVHGAGGPLGSRLADDFTTLAELARAEGYDTAAFTEGGAVAGQLGFHQGFESYSNGADAQPAPLGQVAKTLSRAAEWAEQRAGRPFLLFVHTYELHWPYRAPPALLRRFKGRGPRLPTPSQATDLEYLQGELPKPNRDGIVAAYDAGIAYADEVVGAFIARLRRAGLIDKSLVVVFSDHGEEFWEHGGTTHGLSLYDEVLRVPLFIRLPGNRPPRGRVPVPVSPGDIFATLVRQLGFDATIPSDSHDLAPLWNANGDGTYQRTLVTSSLVQRRSGWVMVSARDPETKYIVTTHFDNEQSPLSGRENELGRYPTQMELLLLDHLLTGGRDVFQGESEALRREMLLSAREEFFDLTVDPTESRDLSLAEHEPLQAQRHRLRDALAGLAQDIEPDLARPPMEPLSADHRAELEALGYVE